MSKKGVKESRPGFLERVLGDKKKAEIEDWVEQGEKIFAAAKINRKAKILVLLQVDGDDVCHALISSAKVVFAVRQRRIFPLHGYYPQYRMRSTNYVNDYALLDCGIK